VEQCFAIALSDFFPQVMKTISNKISYSHFIKKNRGLHNYEIK